MTDTTCADGATQHEDYDGLLTALRARFGASTAGDERLLTTDASGIFEAFLAALPPERRQHYTCGACRRFCERFGGLVLVRADGATESPLWSAADVPAFFRASVAAMAEVVAGARVTGVFLCDEKVWGMPTNRDRKRGCSWEHLAVTPPRALVHRPSPVLTTGQRMAELREDHGTLARAVAEFSPAVVEQAHALLSTEALYRGEKVLGVAAWLRDLHGKLAATRDERRRDHLLWYAAATAPAGFCHVRSTMIGTLLGDLAEGKPTRDVVAAFAAKMHPLQYQRPQTAPSEGNVAQAEKIVAALGTAGALARRFARLEDVLEKVWAPERREAAASAPAGVFAHLRTREKKAEGGLEIPATTMTWVKFEATVLPQAARLELLVPSGRAPFVALVTAADPAAPPILQWDREERRNPVSWYFYSGGSEAAQWALTAGAHVEVTAVTRKPSMWGGGFEHQGKDVFFLLAGARDTKHDKSGGFFVEMLKSEYHPVRKTLEAHMLGATIAGRDEATACGVGFAGRTLRVTRKDGSRMTVTLDRWD